MTQSTYASLGVILRANRSIGTGHLMRVKPILALLKPYFNLHLYVYAFDENLSNMLTGYDQVSIFNTKEEILEHLLNLPSKASATLSNTSQTLATSVFAPTTNEVDSTTGKVASTTDNIDSTKNNTGATIDEILSTIDEVDSTTDDVYSSTEYLPDVLLIDDYAIDRSFEEPLYQRTKVIVFDELHDRYHCCHKLLSIAIDPTEPNEFHHKYCNADCKLLTGNKYSLTAQRFSPNFFIPDQPRCNCAGHFGGYSGRVKRSNLNSGSNFDSGSSLDSNFNSTPSSKPHATCICQDHQAQPIPRVFISFGGADPVSACLKLTSTILESRLYEQYCFTMVAGMSNSDYPEILKLLQDKLPVRYQDNFILIKQCTDIADLLFRNDLAIGAYGGMTFERVTALIPSIGVVIADNQISYRDTCDQYHFGLTLKLEELSDSTKVKAALSDLLTNAATYTQNCNNVYDGHGLENIAQEIIDMVDH